jgi:hypothetical protein
MGKANQIWKIGHLQSKVVKAGGITRTKGSLAYQDGEAASSCMGDVLAPAGYHQMQRIADAFGMDFDEDFSNEYEWDRFRQELSDRKAKVGQDLQRRLPLPEGVFFRLRYDREGNFGLLLRSEDPPMAKGGERII